MGEERHAGTQARRHAGLPAAAESGSAACATDLEQYGSRGATGGSSTSASRALPIPPRAKRCDSRVAALKVALHNAGLRDGMRISSHHHFRNGDLVAVPLFQAAAELGVKDLIWFPSACFPCHEPLIELLESGVIHHVEGSMNGPIGNYCSTGKMRGLGVLRSHGGRWQAVQDGEVHIDIAVPRRSRLRPLRQRQRR